MYFTLSAIGFEWKKYWFVSLWVLFVLRFMRLLSSKVKGLSLLIGVSSISIQCMVNWICSTVLTTWKVLRKAPWMSESLENDRWPWGSVAHSFFGNKDGSKWITIVNFTLWHDLRQKHYHPPFLRIVFRLLWGNHFSSCMCILKVLCVYANCMQNARFQLMHTIDAKLCSHLTFERQNQNSYRNFGGSVRSLAQYMFRYFLGVLYFSYIKKLYLPTNPTTYWDVSGNKAFMFS